MKLLAVFLVLFACTVKAQNPYLKLVYDSLVIYDYENKMGDEPGTNIYKKGNVFEFGFKPVKSAKLTKEAAKDFTFRIGVDSSYGQGVASCYDPHFAAMFYKGGKAIANVEVCIECNRLYPNLELKAQNQNPWTTDEGEVYYLNTGMSRGFRLYMKALLTKYGFSHIPHGGSMFDTDD